MTPELANLFAQLDDPRLYVKLEARQVFDEHDEDVTDLVRGPDGKPVPRLGPDGKPLQDAKGQPVYQTEQRKVHWQKPHLEYVARKTNERASQGVLPTLNVGHTLWSPDGQMLPEKDQPEPVGYAKNFRVTFDPDKGKHVVVADYHIRRDKEAYARSFPRTSVELWPGDWFFDPVALLRRTPRLDLKQWTYTRASDGRRVIRYSMEDYAMDQHLPPVPPAPPTGTPAPQVPPTPQAPVDTPEHHARVHHFMKHVFGHPHVHYMMHHYGMPPVPAEGAAPGPGEPDADENLPPTAPLGNEPPPQHHAAGPGFPSPTSAFTPSTGAAPHRPEQHMRTGAPDLYARVARLEAENARLLAINQKMSLDYQRDKRRGDLEQIAQSAPGFINVDEMLREVEALPEEQYAKQLGLLTKATHYARSAGITGDGVPVSRARVEAHKKPEMTREQSRKAVKMATETGKPFNECARDVMANGTGE